MSNESSKTNNRKEEPKEQPKETRKESPKYETPTTAKRNLDSFDSDKK